MSKQELYAPNRQKDLGNIYLSEEHKSMNYYLNPRNTLFEMARFSDIYVDKSMLIAELNKAYRTAKRYICVSRPRRFGKSMGANMLSAYYSRGCDSAALFSGLKIEEHASYKKHLNKHNVIRLDIQRFLFSKSHLDIFIDKIQEMVIQELREEYGDCFQEGFYGLPGVLEQIYAKTGEGFIFIIDEWDCVMREKQEDEAAQKQYLDFLRDLLKDQPYVAFAYMTGILPVDETSRWYDGYRLRRFKHVYNLRSVVAAMRGHYFSNYWTSTETYEALKIYMDMDFDGLRADIVRMLSGGGVRVNTFSFQNDMRTFRSKDDVLTLLIHLGYLGYDAEKKEAFIPNKEIMGEFENAMGAAITLAYYSAEMV